MLFSHTAHSQHVGTHAEEDNEHIDYDELNSIGFKARRKYGIIWRPEIETLMIGTVKFKEEK